MSLLPFHFLLPESVLLPTHFVLEASVFSLFLSLYLVLGLCSSLLVGIADLLVSPNFLHALIQKNFPQFSFLSLIGGFFSFRLARRPRLLAIVQKLGLLKGIAKKEHPHARILEKAIAGTLTRQGCKEKTREYRLCRVSWQHVSDPARGPNQDL